MPAGHVLGQMIEKYFISSEIKIDDGLYDDANKKYLFAFQPEQKPRTSLPFILHQADLMAARIEFEREWLPKFKNPVPSQEENFTLKETKKSTKDKALSQLESKGLKDLFDKL